MVDLVGPIQHKRGTTAQWASSTIPLRDGELGIDTTLRRMKVGDGATLWAGLPFQDVDQATVNRLEDAAATLGDAVAVNDAAMTLVQGDPASAFSVAQKATFAPKSVQTTVETGRLSATGVASSAIAAVGLEVTSAFRPCRMALDAGRSAAIWVSGDSTADASTGRRPVEYAALDVAAAIADLHVISITQNPSTGRFDAPTVLRAGPNGQRYVSTTARALRYLPAATMSIANAGIEIEADIEPTSWTPTAKGTIVSWDSKSVSGTISTELHAALYLNTDGKLQMNVSANGSSWGIQIADSVAMSAANGARQRVKASIKADGSNVTSKFFHSVDNGKTWVQHGSTYTYASASTLFAPTAGSFISIGAGGWQPASSAFAGKIYEVHVRDGENGRELMPVLPELWERYGDPSVTYGGSPTLTIVNAARAGTALSYHATQPQFEREIVDYGQNVLIFCDSHNEGGASGEVPWLVPYAAWVDAVAARFPRARVAVIKQNPHTSAWVNEAAFGYSHKLRLDELVGLASARGWSVVDFYAPLRNAPEGLAYWLDADGLHPTDGVPAGESNGYLKLGHVLARAMGYLPGPA